MYTLQIIEKSESFYECKLLDQFECKNVTLNYFKLLGKWEEYKDVYNEYRESFILTGTRDTAILEFKSILNIDSSTKCKIKAKEFPDPNITFSLNCVNNEQLKQIMGW